MPKTPKKPLKRHKSKRSSTKRKRVKVHVPKSHYSLVHSPITDKPPKALKAEPIQSVGLDDTALFAEESQVIWDFPVKPKPIDRNSPEYRLDHEPDYVFSKRFDFSLAKLLARYAEDASDRICAAALMMGEEDFVSWYAKIVEKLRSLMGIKE